MTAISLCFGERVVGVGLALDLVAVFLGAKFLGERHADAGGQDHGHSGAV